MARRIAQGFGVGSVRQEACDNVHIVICAFMACGALDTKMPSRRAASPSYRPPRPATARRSPRVFVSSRWPTISCSFLGVPPLSL